MRTFLLLIVLGALVALGGASAAGKGKKPKQEKKPDKKKASSKVECAEKYTWPDLLIAVKGQLDTDPRRFENGWDQLGMYMAARYECVLDGKAVPGRYAYNVGSEGLIGMSEDERAKFWAEFETTLTAAGDNCAAERVVVWQFYDVGALQAGFARGYVAALWRCDRAGGKNADRACQWARAKNDAVWLSVAVNCGDDCTASMDAAEACRWAFGAIDDKREQCVKDYEPVQQAERSACAPFACQDAREADDIAWDRLIEDCKQKSEECWRDSEEHKKAWDECQELEVDTTFPLCSDPEFKKKGGRGKCRFESKAEEDCKRLGSRDKVRAWCEGYEKPCAREQGIEAMCVRATAGPSENSSKRDAAECKKTYKKQAKRVAGACPQEPE